MLELASIPRSILESGNDPWDVFWGRTLPWLGLAIVAALALIFWRAFKELKRFQERFHDREAREFDFPVLRRELWMRLVPAAVVVLPAILFAASSVGTPRIIPTVQDFLFDTLTVLSLLLLLPAGMLVVPLMKRPYRIRVGSRYIHVESFDRTLVIPVEECQGLFQIRDTQRRLRGLEVTYTPPEGTRVLPLAALFWPPLMRAKGPVTERILFRPALGPEGEALIETLGDLGLRAETRLLLLDADQPFSILRLVVDLALGVFFLVVAYNVALVTLFWINWLFFGGMNSLTSFLLALPMAAVYLVGFFLLGPVRGWFWKGSELLTAREPFNVEIAEGFAAPSEPMLTTSRALMEAQGDSLLFHFQGRRLRIRRRDLTRLTVKPQGWSGPLSLFGYRFLNHPVMIQWVTEEAAEHCILVHASVGATLSGDRWLTNRLYAYLCRWRDGDAADLGVLSVEKRRRALPAFVLFAGLFLLVPVIHNQLLVTHVRQGIWKPNIAGPLKVAYVRRVGSTIPAVDSQSVLVLESADPFSAQRWWRLNLETMSYSFLCFETDVMLAQPGNPDALLTASLNPYILQMVPPGLPFRLNRLLIDTADGSITEANWLPDRITTPQGALNQQGWVAMPGPPIGTGIFIETPRREVYPLNSLRDFLSRDLTGVDGEAGGANELSTEVAPLEMQDVAITVYSPDPAASGARGIVRGVGSTGLIFFPDGQTIIGFWEVLDLRTGEARSISLPHELGAHLEWWGRSLNTFPLGEDLGLRVCLEIDGQLVNEVWRIDRAGNCAVIGTLAPNEYLLSVDGSRWLLAHLSTGETLTVHVRENADPETSRLLFEGDADARYSLVRGQDRVLVGLPQGGLLLRDFEGRVVQRLD